MGASWWLCFNRRCQWLNAIAVGIVLRVLSYKVCTNIERAETLRISKIRTLRLLCCLAISWKFFIVIYFWIWYTVSLSRQFIPVCCIIFFINPRTDTKIDQKKKKCPLGTTVLVPHQLWNFSTKHRLKKSFDCKKWCISGWQTLQTLYFSCLSFLGPCMAGIVGSILPRYGVFGETLDIAYIMKSSCHRECLEQLNFYNHSLNFIISN